MIGEVPPKVEYSPTDLGETLNTALLPLGEWVDRHMRELIDRKHPNEAHSV
ncbi:winged helix-turn-helix transcriptional regulator [Streptomyces sp. NPDC058251]|uniref:winged helix-turn-helix transcriptional regulator n=1 Tax=unclassified Streptomyces TaxID=2593676 RepID=UPI0033DB6961